MDARYLNVDFVIKSDSDLTAFAEFFEGKVFFLWKELTKNQSSLGFETNLVNTSGPEEDIAELLNLLDSMPTDLLSLWTNIKEKIMDIGYECGSMAVPLESFLSSITVRRLARWGYAINIRLYPSADRPSEIVEKE